MLVDLEPGPIDGCIGGDAGQIEIQIDALCTPVIGLIVTQPQPV